MRIYLVTFPPHQIIRFSCRRYFWWYFSGFLFICVHVSLITSSTHIFPDELGDGAGQHEAGDGAAHDVEEGVHDPRAGGGFDRRTEGTAERARRRSTATAYLRRRRRKGRRQLSIHTNTNTTKGDAPPAGEEAWRAEHTREAKIIKVSLFI